MTIPLLPRAGSPGLDLPSLNFRMPFPAWLPLVGRRTLAADAVAGLTGAVVALPQGVAFATIAGMPPEYGLYAGIVPAIIAALCGSSWHLVSGPTTAASIVLLSALSPFAEPGSAHYVQLALTLTFMVGLLQLTMGAFRLGTLVDFISHSVVIGFTAGAAVLIAANQVTNFFGLPIPRGSHFHEVVVHLVTRIPEIDPAITGVALLTLLTGVLVKRFVPKIPYMIVAILAGSGAAYAANRLGASVPAIGALPSALPPLSAPSLSFDTFRQLAPGALAMTLFALTEAVSISRALAVRSGQQINGNREFIGQGLSNIVGSFFSAYVATGSFNRSGLNYQAGAKTPLAAVFAGLLLAVAVVLLTPLAAYLPTAAMAGVLFLVAWGLIDFHHIRQILKSSRAETAILAVTFFGAILAELEVAILAGVILSLLLYLNRTSRPQILARVPDPANPKRKFTTDPLLPECPQIKIVRLDGSLFFGAVPYVLARLRSVDPGQKHLAMVASGINFIDIAGAEALVQEARRRRDAGGGLYLIGLKEAARHSLHRGGHLEEIGDNNAFRSKTEALAAIQARFERSICKTCDRSVFLECDALRGCIACPSNAAEGAGTR
ncbi:MAG: SulP family inorganic anion transporter [Magnetospirillum sp. WYHS-4]